MAATGIAWLTNRRRRAISCASFAVFAGETTHVNPPKYSCFDPSTSNFIAIAPERAQKIANTGYSTTTLLPRTPALLLPVIWLTQSTPEMRVKICKNCTDSLILLINTDRYIDFQRGTFTEELLRPGICKEI